MFIFNETGFIEGKRLKEGLHIASLTLKSKHNPIHHDTNGKEYQDTYHYDAKEHKWALLGDIITKKPQQSKLPPYVYEAPIPPLLSDKEISKGIAKAVADILQNEPTKLLKKESCNQINQWKKLIQFKPGWILSLYNDTFTKLNPERELQKIQDANGIVINLDYFPVKIHQLPVVHGRHLSAPEFLSYENVAREYGVKYL